MGLCPAGHRHPHPFHFPFPLIEVRAYCDAAVFFWDPAVLLYRTIVVGERILADGTHLEIKGVKINRIPDWTGSVRIGWSQIRQEFIPVAEVEYPDQGGDSGEGLRRLPGEYS